MVRCGGYQGVCRLRGDGTVSAGPDRQSEYASVGQQPVFHGLVCRASGGAVRAGCSRGRRIRCGSKKRRTSYVSSGADSGSGSDGLWMQKLQIWRPGDHDRVPESGRGEALQLYGRTLLGRGAVRIRYGSSGIFLSQVSSAATLFPKYFSTSG